MPHRPQDLPPLFHFDVFAEGGKVDKDSPVGSEELIIELLRQLVVAQERQNRLLEELLQQHMASQKQRSNDLAQWKEEHPDLAYRCRRAAETLSRVQDEFLGQLTDAVAENEDCLLDGEFMLSEFVDRFGPRLAHLSGVLQILSQLAE